MEPYQREFIEFALERGVLRFGEFRLKSGRTSPYFFNSGSFCDGTSLGRLARFYVQAIDAAGLQFDVLYGPAYKGIPLASAVAVAYGDLHGRCVPFCFNRKEAKDHGEGGATVGAPLEGRVLVVDDVISAGTSARESVEIIRRNAARPVGMAISLDRQERGAGRRSAIQEVEDELGLEVINIIALEHLVHFLEQRRGMASELDRVRAYRRAHGVSAA